MAFFALLRRVETLKSRRKLLTEIINDGIDAGECRAPAPVGIATTIVAGIEGTSTTQCVSLDVAGRLSASRAITARRA